MNHHSTSNVRFVSLDWLRGTMALAVMFYHLTLWLYFPLDSSSVLGRLGVYAVSVFFVLSGLSMAIVYHGFFSNWKQFVVFWIRRIFRIWPLLWLSILLVVIHPNFKVDNLDLNNLLMTATTVFAIVQPAKYFIIGAWSIGNEMVYYLVSPFLFLAYQYKIWVGNFLFGISIVLALFFAFEFMNPQITLAKQWSTYVNPWNNLFFYVAGISIYYALNQKIFSKKLLLFINLSALSILILLPNSGNQINLVFGLNRIIYSLFSVLLVIGFYKNTFSPPNFLQRVFQILGESTYGIYLLHPIIYSYVGLFAKKMGQFSSPILFISTSFITILFAYFSFVFIEKPLMKIGKKWTNYPNQAFAGYPNK